MLGRKGIVRHFGSSVGKPTQERRFTRIRQSDQTGVGDYLELEDDPTFFARGSRLGLARSAIGSGGKGAIAPAALSAQSDGHFLVSGRQILDHVAPIPVQD